MNKRPLLSSLALLAMNCLLAAAPAALHAQARYPAGPVTLVVPFPAGGPTDVYARVIGQKLSAKLGQPFIVENRAGATGLIGEVFVQKAKPDGYTLLLASNSSHVLAPLMKTKLPFDPVTDFEPLGMLGSYPLALLVGPKVPANNLAELIDLAKKNPGQVNIGSIGEGSVIHLAGEIFKIKTGTKIQHIPYRGTPPLTTALMAGEIEMEFNSVSSVKTLVDSGRGRALAVTGDKRAALLPDVPSLAELGIAGVDVRVWIGAFAPKGTPKPVLAVLEREIHRLLTEDADVKKAFAESGTDIVASSPAVFAEAMRKERKLWQPLIESLKLAKD
ncbi:Tripartite-type tricarboxylate transporter, receptor component TctC [Polaromonas sp. YR568]|uniref:Bug family tripartite tricarboxylate transporter substrate binding protein n=1 Tax=Polaromonas sp. YR568 TaxID=1855301 RepID=UPI0008E5B137|nr:tripartite tricarboxylate transporter substrate binding protein [Polaromonas sp. YR568]SFU61887.1 Tripartite-type tricarboxylate transporter, receptor component TctC [Polaromonas sp. YR568]